jgi:Trehalase
MHLISVTFAGQWRDLIINGSAPGGVSLVVQNPGNFVSNFIPLWVRRCCCSATNTLSGTPAIVSFYKFYFFLCVYACLMTSSHLRGQVGVAPAEGPQALAALDAFKRSGLLGPAGVATTDANTGQQWDLPNAWPPLQDIVIEALENYGGARTGQLMRRSICAVMQAPIGRSCRHSASCWWLRQCLTLDCFTHWIVS